MSWAEQRARLLGLAAPEPPVKDTAYWESRCWRDDCENEPLSTEHPRLRGRYCAPCLVVVEADAERITAEFGVLV